MLHATRLMQMANRLSTEEAENPPLAGEVRSQMLEDLLKLQEAALELLEAATSSVLNSGGPVREITVEIINEFTEEMKRVVYVRREQVFTSRHLSHRLRSLEAERNRGLLVRRWNMENMDRKPEKSLKSKLAELTSGGTWIKQPLQETKQTLSERLSQQASSRRKKRKPKATRSTAVEGAQTPKISSEDISLLVEVPPRPKLQRRFSQMRRQTQGTQGNLGKMDTTYPEQPQQASGGFSASKEAQTVEGTQQLPHQAPVSVSPPGRALPELAKAYSRLSLGSTGRRPRCDDSPYSGQAASSLLASSTGRRPRCDDSPYSGQAASSLLASSPRLTVPATGETLEKSGGTRAPEIRPVGSEEAPRSSWSRAWSPGSPFSRLYQATDQTTAAAAYATETVQGVSSQQPHPSKVGPQGNFMPPHASPPPSFPVTTSQSLASDAYEAIHSPRPQAPHMHMQNLVSLELAAASPVPSPTSSSLKRKETPQPIGVLISPVPEGSPADLHSVEQGMGGTKDSMGILPVVEVPPRPKHRFSLMRRQPPGTQGNLGKMDTTHPEQPQQASGGVSASNEAQSVEGTQQLPHQAPVSISPPPQALPEASSRLSLGSTGHQPRDDGSPYSGQAASSLLASSAQPTVTAAGETLEKSGGARDPETTRGTKDSMEGPSGLPSAPPSLPEFFKGRRAGDALEESPWLDSDSDSG
ncbi:hypothetical protein EPH_0065860 [Eimeria praecox]|uniref:Uncharacterized protein n=1 Tax=Eimeria praecox TaxID=51316 RepID=U6HB93_9EIME|nr:hypothetical protein EPH_0065860 [Eimeria praecox]